MKKIIIIFLFIPLIDGSVKFNNELNDLFNTLKIVNNTLGLDVRDQRTINYMKNKKIQILSDIESCLSR